MEFLCERVYFVFLYFIIINVVSFSLCLEQLNIFFRIVEFNLFSLS